MAADQHTRKQIRDFGPEPNVPVLDQVHMSARLAAFGTRIQRHAIDSAAPNPARPDLLRLAGDFALWAEALRRLSHSGPRAWIASVKPLRHTEDLSTLKDSAEARRGKALTVAAHVDFISFLAIGDMILESSANALMPGHQTQWPWATFMGRVDAGDFAPLARHARRLDLILREARHRLVAHRIGDHYTSISWEEDGSMRVGHSQPFDAGPAYRTLHNLRVAIGLPNSGEAANPGWRDYYLVRRHVLGHAYNLDRRSRDEVRKAFRLAGYDTFDPVEVAWDALRLDAEFGPPLPARAPR